MFARVSDARFPPAQHDAGLRVVIEELLLAFRHYPVIPAQRREGRPGSTKKPQEDAAMYPEMVANMMAFRAEHELRIAKIARQRLAIENGAWSARRRPAWTALRRHAGDALVFLGERLRGTTVAAATPLEPASR